MNTMSIYITGHEGKPATSGSVGYDLEVAEDTIIYDDRYTLVPTKFKSIIPSGCVGLLLPRSSAAYKNNIEVVIGTIDQDYRGYWNICCKYVLRTDYVDSIYKLNPSGTYKHIVKKGARIAQAVFIKLANANVIPVDEKQYIDIVNNELENERKEGGFGSTDKE